MILLLDCVIIIGVVSQNNEGVNMANGKEKPYLGPRIRVGKDGSIRIVNFEEYMHSQPVRDAIKKIVRMDLTGARNGKKTSP